MAASINVAASDFQRQGFVAVPGLLTREDIDHLKNEATALEAAYKKKGLGPHDTGCVLDALVDVNIHESDPARTTKDRYIAHRWRSSSDMSNAIANILFTKLPQFASELLGASKTRKTRDGGMEECVDLFFFNEHYVVKPPHSKIGFRWHTDAQEQLAMLCLPLEDQPVYLSAWCALDDMNDQNGTLSLFSYDDVPREEGWESSTSEDGGLLPNEIRMSVKKGTVVFFASDVWHRSSHNRGDDVRRVFYAQYSSGVISSRPPRSKYGGGGDSDSVVNADTDVEEKKAPPLCFAIPCYISPPQVRLGLKRRNSENCGKTTTGPKLQVEKRSRNGIELKGDCCGELGDR